MKHYTGYGLGDALWLAAILRQQPGTHHVCSPSGGVLDALKCLKFVAVGEFSNDGDRTISNGEYPYETPLRLDERDFVGYAHPEVPGRYTAVQPATTKFSVRRMPYEYAFNAVLIGSQDDRCVDYGGGLDLRGELTIRQSIGLVVGATWVVGVDSWVALLGGLLGKPTTMFAGGSSYERLADILPAACPTITLVRNPLVG